MGHSLTRPTVALLTDFGLQDAYVGVMKGVLLKSAPDCQIVDLNHSISPQAVTAAAFELLTAHADFPAGTLFLCVVDPGVGTERAILYAEAGDWRFMAPDNGLLSWVLDKYPNAKVWTIDRSRLPTEKISRTFHGRDIFAPVAGALLAGDAIENWAVPATAAVKIKFPTVEKIGSRWTGDVIWIDRFGNLITNFATSEVLALAAHAKVWFHVPGVSATIRGLSDSYSSVEKKHWLAIGGSSGFVELSVRDGNAATESGAAVGTKIVAEFLV